MDEFDFFEFKTDQKKNLVYPEFNASGAKDIVRKGGAFYAYWEDSIKMWNTDLNALCNKIDFLLWKRAEEVSKTTGVYFTCDTPKKVGKAQKELDIALKHGSRDDILFDRKVFFYSDEPKREDYCSKKLSYDPVNVDTPCYDEFMNTIWTPEDRQMLEWGIGSIFCGDSSKIQKFFVMYGSPGSGKSTMIKIMKELFEAYSGSVNVTEIANPSTQFQYSSLEHNPLFGYCDDADLSRMKNTSGFNSVVSHEPISMNLKNKNPYVFIPDTMLYIGTNKTVQFDDTRSGMARRLLTVRPTNVTIPPDRFDILYAKLVNEEIPGIAYHCMEVYKRLGKHAYDDYIDMNMYKDTNDLHLFLTDILNDDDVNIDFVQLRVLYNKYKEWCKENGTKEYNILERKTFDNQIAEYWKHRKNFDRHDGKQYRDVVTDFKYEKLFPNASEFKPEEHYKPEESYWLTNTTSIFDEEFADFPAQRAKRDGSPKMAWDNVSTKLRDIRTTELHYVMVPENHIVIDFDIKNKYGEKDRVLNEAAAKEWPPTYAEYSKSGAGIHLHYIYAGDVSKLAKNITEDIECKVYTGKSSLRRQLTYCNDKPFNTLPEGYGKLIFKSEKFKGDDVDLANMDENQVDKYLRSIIANCIAKKHHGHTAPEVSYILDRLTAAYDSGKSYDVSDMKEDVFAFCADSSNQRKNCIAMYKKMHFRSKEYETSGDTYSDDEPIIFYDVEVYKNLFLICWKKQGADQQVMRMFNPSPDDVLELSKKKLVGFNNRGYDSHMLYYYGYLGYSTERLYEMSQAIVTGNGGTNAAAYSIGYADCYDIASKKQSLKKWEIELGIIHKESEPDWDLPLPEEEWEAAGDYCANDVIATEAVWDHISQDIVAREIMCDISGLPMITGQQRLVQTIIFPGLSKEEIKAQLQYTDLTELFPGYKFEQVETFYKDGRHKNWEMQSSYRDHIVGEGGWVEYEPGYYENVVCFDVASMHPHSLIELNLFGDYTKNFKDIVDARIFVKHKDFESASQLFDGKLAKYLKSEDQSKALAQALKMIINPVYGYTGQKVSAFYDDRNVDNIVAKRGSLFMVNVYEAVREAGYQVIHVKTDSIKVVNPDERCEQIIMDLGKQYGYSFEVEDRFARFCLINKAAYIALDEDGVWHSKATQFNEPYVFKTLFSKEEVTFDDLCQTKSVKDRMYLDFNESLPEGEHNRIFVGKVGRFTPIKPGQDGGLLVKSNKTKDGDTKFDAVTGTKGYRWKESFLVLNDMNQVDFAYFDKMAEEAKFEVEKWVDYEYFTRK